jgi:tetratricopeptide (TPR) repeat protein
MALNPKDRYATSRNLAEDVKRFLADEPVQAYQEPVLEKTKRWIRKNRTLVGAAMVVLMLVTVGAMCFGFVTSRFNAQLRVSEGKAVNQQKIAEAQKAKAVQANSILVTYLDSGTPSRILKAFMYAFCRPNVVREEMVSAAALTSIPDSFFQLGEKKILEDSPNDPQFGMHVKLAFAGIYRSRGLLKQALELQNNVLDFSRNNKDLDPWERGLVYREYAWTKQLLGDFESALINYNLAIQEFKQDKVALNNKGSRQAREFANLHLLRAYFYFEILDFNQASQELDSAFLASDDKEVKNIALGIKELHLLMDKPLTPGLIQNAIEAMELIAPGAGKDIDFLSIVQVLSNKTGIQLFGQKDMVALSGDINSSFRKYLGDYNSFTLIGESHIATFLLKNGKTKEGFTLFDKVIGKLKKTEVFLSPSIVTGVLTPYTDFALDSKETEQLTKIHQINKEYKNQANINFGKNSQSALHASTFFCVTLISMKKHDEAKELITEISENLKTSNDIIFPISANQLLKLIERLGPIDQNNELLKSLFALFNKRTSAEFKSRDRFKIKERIAQIEKKIKE